MLARVSVVRRSPTAHAKGNPNAKKVVHSSLARFNRRRIRGTHFGYEPNQDSFLHLLSPRRKSPALHHVVEALLPLLLPLPLHPLTCAGRRGRPVSSPGQGRWGSRALDRVQIHLQVAAPATGGHRHLQVAAPAPARRSATPRLAGISRRSGEAQGGGAVLRGRWGARRRGEAEGDGAFPAARRGERAHGGARRNSGREATRKRTARRRRRTAA